MNLMMMKLQGPCAFLPACSRFKRSNLIAMDIALRVEAMAISFASVQAGSAEEALI